MTRDELLARYDLIEQATSGNVETHHALHPSGAVVMVHFIHGSTAFQAQMADAAHRASEGASSAGKILHVHMVDGHPVVVTRFLTDFVTLEHWFASLGIAPAPAGGQGPSPVTPQAPEAPAPHHAGLDRSSLGPSDGDAPTEQLGEFTQMFSALPPPATPPVTPDQAATVETRRPRPREELPKAPVVKPPEMPSPPPSEPRPPADPSGPGEFTRLFRTPMGENPPPPPPDRPQPPVPVDPPPPPPPSGGGEFTRLFQAAGPPDPDRNPWTDPARRPPSAGPPPEVRKPGAVPGPSQPTGGPPPGAPRDAATSGPGEFTKFFKPPVQPTEPPLTYPAPDPPLFAGSGGGSEAQPPSAAPGGGSWSEALRSSRPPGPHTPEPPPVAPPPDEGRGEFTQIFGRDSVLPPPPPTMPVPGKGAERPGPSGVPPSPKSSPPTAPSAPAVPGGLRGVPRAPRLPGAESLLRNAAPRGGVRVPRAPIPPSARQLGRMALGGMQASGSASQGSTAEESEAGPSRSDAGDHPKGPSVAFAVGLTLVVVASLVLVLFFALWDFEGPAPAEEPVAEPVTADSVG